MNYKLLLIARERVIQGVSIHSQVIEFDSKQEADLAEELLSGNPFPDMRLSVVKLYGSSYV